MASRRTLGNVTLAIEDARDVWIWPSLERLWQDVRYGLRLLRRQPSFSAFAILILTVGMGATTAVFSVVEFELWKPLPFPRADRLVAIYTTRTVPGKTVRRVTAGAADWRAQSHTFEQLAGYGNKIRRVLRVVTGPESVAVLPVTSNFFETLRRDPARGRTFDRWDDGASHMAMISDACWRRLFSSDPEIVGGPVSIDGEPYTIVGITSSVPFEFMTTPDVFVVVDLRARPDRTARDLSVFGRLREDASLESAYGIFEVVAQRLARDYPAAQQGRGVRLEGLRETSTGWNWRPLFFSARPSSYC